MKKITSPFAGLNLYTTLGTLIGFGLIWGDMQLSGAFGLSISRPVMWIAMGLSLASGILLVLAAMHYYRGFKPLGITLAVVWAFAFAFNVYSNMGVATSDRVGNIKQANHQTDTRSMVLKGKAADEAKIKLLTAHIDKLRNQRGWTATQSSAAIAAKVNGYPGIEANIWNRTDQCTNATIKVSIAYCKAYSELKQDLATAKDIEAKERMITASETAITNARTRLANLPTGHSEAKEQSKLHALLADFRLSGPASDTGIQAANNFTGLFLALALAVVAAGVTLAGAWPLIMGINNEPANPVHSREGWGSSEAPPPATKARQEPGTNVIISRVEDRTGLELIASLANRYQVAA